MSLLFVKKYSTQCKLKEYVKFFYLIIKLIVQDDDESEDDDFGDKELSSDEEVASAEIDSVDSDGITLNLIPECF